MFFKACFFIFYKIKWGEGKLPPHTPPLKKFLFKKENDACELKGGRPVNGIAKGTSNAKNRDMYCVFLTMEMIEHGYKIKGPH